MRRRQLPNGPLDECTADEICLERVCAPRSTERRFCAKGCGSNDDCRGGYECRLAGTRGSLALTSSVNPIGPLLRPRSRPDAETRARRGREPGVRLGCASRSWSLLAATPPARAGKAVDGVVNLNTAPVEVLGLLPGIGPAKAADIAAYRKKRPFRTVDELVRIKGIGRKMVRRLRVHLAVAGPTTAAGVIGGRGEAVPPPAPAPPPPPPPGGLRPVREAADRAHAPAPPAPRHLARPEASACVHVDVLRPSTCTSTALPVRGLAWSRRSAPPPGGGAGGVGGLSLGRYIWTESATDLS